jgi:mortality factor 4-like protein 1
MLVSLPSKHPANKILHDYLEMERLNRREGSAEADILEEAIAGLEEYFNKCLGRILLYTFERGQYEQLRHTWTNEEGKGAGDVYGGEHLLRLIGKS